MILRNVILPAMLMLASLPLAAQNNITGTVVDGKGNPFPGVRIDVNGTTTSTVSDIDGAFSLPAYDNLGRKFTATYVGMRSAKGTLKDDMTIRMRSYTRWNRPPEDWDWFVQPVYAFNFSGARSKANGFGLMVGRLKNIGYYAKVVMNADLFKTISVDPSIDLKGNPTGLQYFFFTAGTCIRINSPLHLYIGMGYSMQTYTWGASTYPRAENNQLYTSNFDYNNGNGMALDCGFLLRLMRVTLSVGVTESYFFHFRDYTGIALNAGIGYSF